MKAFLFFWHLKILTNQNTLSHSVSILFSLSFSFLNIFSKEISKLFIFPLLVLIKCKKNSILTIKKEKQLFFPLERFSDMP